jgi:hypothetical protein
MSRFIFSFFAIFTFLLAGTAHAQQARKPASVPANPLVYSLPASDAVVAFDAQKFLGTALPQLLGADSPQMAKINAHIDLIKNKTGLDLRQFEQAAVGIKYKQVSATEVDFEPLILASGKFNAGAILALVKIAANGKYREEQVGGKAVYVLQLSEILAEVQGQQPGKSSGLEKMVEKMLRTFSGEFAVGALSDNTLAMGSLARVQETFSRTAPLSAELKTMVNTKPAAVLSFAGNMPAGMSKMFGLENDEIAKTVDSIKNLFGYLDMNAGNASVKLGAKTLNADQAQTLEETIIGLKMLGKAFIGTIKGTPAEREIYSRMVDNAKVSRLGTLVQIDLLIPQSDLSILAKKL